MSSKNKNANSPCHVGCTESKSKWCCCYLLSLYPLLPPLLRSKTLFPGHSSGNLKICIEASTDWNHIVDGSKIPFPTTFWMYKTLQLVGKNLPSPQLVNAGDLPSTVALRSLASTWDLRSTELFWRALTSAEGHLRRNWKLKDFVVLFVGGLWYVYI